jgi:hypothetical protein
VAVDVYEGPSSSHPSFAPCFPHQPSLFSPLPLPSPRRALDLIFVLVDESNSEEVVGELVLSLSSAQSALKEDMVVKIAILAEKYSPGLVSFLFFVFLSNLR